MPRLILRKDSHTPGHCRLCVRTHDMGGTSYDTVLEFPIETGNRISLGNNGIRWIYREDAPEGGEPMDLTLGLREDATEKRNPWILFGVDGDELMELGKVSSDTAFSIKHGMAAIPFIDGDLAWERHDRLLDQLKADGLRKEAQKCLDKADEIEAKLGRVTA